MQQTGEGPVRQSWKERFFYSPAPSVEDRSAIRLAVNNAILHLHPIYIPASALRFTYTWGLGGISATLAFLLAATGLLLMFRYDASVDRAYTSIQILESEVLFGSLVRAIHHWSANLLVITAFLHMVRVFLTSAYKKGRAVNWLVGLGLLLLVLAFNFTGYLLPWDQKSYWAVTVSTSLLSYIPRVGSMISGMLLAGPEVGQPALRNFYAFHVAVLPAVLVLMLAYHFWKVRKCGGISQPPDPEGERTQNASTIPHLVRREFAVGAVIVTAIVLFSMFIPAPLEGLANPVQSPNPAKAAWYFLGFQELLLHMHALAALGLTALALIFLAALPILDRTLEGFGVYFRSPRGRKAALIGLLISIELVPVLIIADEYWLDLAALLPGLSTTFSTGWLPLAVSLLGLVGVYTAVRLLARGGHDEGLVGLFSFLVISLVVLTIVGVFFRGENMAIALPF